MTKKEYNEEEILFPYKTLKYTKHHFIPTSVVILTLKSPKRKSYVTVLNQSKMLILYPFSTLLLIRHCILLVFITASFCLFDRYIMFFDFQPHNIAYFELVIKNVNKLKKQLTLSKRSGMGSSEYDGHNFNNMMSQMEIFIT